MDDRKGDKHSVSTKMGTAIIEGNKTDVVITEFKNLVFVIATQVKKMGTLVEVSYPACNQSPGAVCGESRILLGKDEPEILAIAQHLSNRLFPFQPILYSLALKNRSSETVRNLGDLVETIVK